jgi:hypothetical protein
MENREEEIENTKWNIGEQYQRRKDYFEKCVFPYSLLPIFYSLFSPDLRNEQ